MFKRIENTVAYVAYVACQSSWLWAVFPDLADQTTALCRKVSIRCERRNLSLHYINI